MQNFASFIQQLLGLQRRLSRLYLFVHHHVIVVATLCFRTFIDLNDSLIDEIDWTSDLDGADADFLIQLDVFLIFSSRLGFFFFGWRFFSFFIFHLFGFLEVWWGFISHFHSISHRQFLLWFNSSCILLLIFQLIQHFTNITCFSIFSLLLCQFLLSLFGLSVFLLSSFFFFLLLWVGLLDSGLLLFFSFILGFFLFLLDSLLLSLLPVLLLLDSFGLGLFLFSDLFLLLIDFFQLLLHNLLSNLGSLLLSHFSRFLLRKLLSLPFRCFNKHLLFLLFYRFLQFIGQSLLLALYGLGLLLLVHFIFSFFFHPFLLFFFNFCFYFFWSFLLEFNQSSFLGFLLFLCQLYLLSFFLKNRSLGISFLLLYLLNSLTFSYGGTFGFLWELRFGLGLEVSKDFGLKLNFYWLLGHGWFTFLFCDQDCISFLLCLAQPFWILSGQWLLMNHQFWIQ